MTVKLPVVLFSTMPLAAPLAETDGEADGAAGAVEVDGRAGGRGHRGFADAHTRNRAARQARRSGRGDVETAHGAAAPKRDRAVQLWSGAAERGQLSSVPLPSTVTPSTLSKVPDDPWPMRCSFVNKVCPVP